jgi:hypothetical protein
MRKKILSWGISLGAVIALGSNAAFALTPSQAVDEAILRTRKNEGVNYGKATLQISADRYETLWFAGFERE